LRSRYWFAFVALASLVAGAACGSYHSSAELEAANGSKSLESSQVGPAAVGGSGLGQAGAAGASAVTSAAGGGVAAGGAGSVQGSSSAAGSGAASLSGPTGAGSGRGALIKIGEVGVYSGIAGSVFAPQPQAVRSYVDHLNATGGINGHLVQLTVIDDGGDPARHRAAVQQLINNGVVAFVGNSETLTGRASIDLLEKYRVPVIGSDTGSPHYYDSAMYFPEASNGNPKFFSDLAATADYAKGHGITKIATLTCTEAQSCGDADGIYASRAAQFGLQVVSRSRVSIAQPDFTAECLAAKNAGAQFLLTVLDPPSISRLAQSCVRLGFRPPFGLSTSSPTVATDPNVSVAVFGSGVFPWVLGDTPARVEYHAVFSTFPNAVFDNISAGGWASAAIFTLAARHTIGPNDTPSSKLVLNGLWGLNGETMGGLTAPLTYRRDQPPPQVACFFPMITAGGKWVSSNGGQYECPAF
jgi:branched-chain amino acid transport system substrate-binding protein